MVSGLPPEALTSDTSRYGTTLELLPGDIQEMLPVFFGWSALLFPVSACRSSASRGVSCCSSNDGFRIISPLNLRLYVAVIRFGANPRQQLQDALSLGVAGGASGRRILIASMPRMKVHHPKRDEGAAVCTRTCMALMAPFKTCPSDAGGFILSRKVVQDDVLWVAGPIEIGDGHKGTYARSA
mmetsp:Transcript_5435/g.15112  ORF Transcript_5435/g.15112 Transcript_5435/m.15112 type:complete len:183 (-) Transcript_5435:151-699(-)